MALGGPPPGPPPTWFTTNQVSARLELGTPEPGHTDPAAGLEYPQNPRWRAAPLDPAEPPPVLLGTCIKKGTYSNKELSGGVCPVGGSPATVRWGVLPGQLHRTQEQQPLLHSALQSPNTHQGPL